mgnify:CR=1 FL=1
MLFKYSKNKASVLEWFWWYKALLAPKRPRFNLLDHLKQLHVEFTLENKVDKSVLGGVLVRLGNTEIDGTIKTRLDGLKNQLSQVI